MMTAEGNNMVPIDRGWAWVILVANFIVVFLIIGCTSSFGLFFAEFMTEFQAPASSITIALSIQTIVFSLSSLFALNIGRSFASNRTYVILGGLFACSAYLISAVIPDVSYLILSLGVLFGVAYGFSYGPALVELGRYFHKKRGIATSLGNMGVSCGSLVFPPVIRFLLDSYGLRGALIVIAGILLNLCVAGALMRPIAFYDDQGKDSKAKQEDGIWSTKTEMYGTANIKDEEVYRSTIKNRASSQQGIPENEFEQNIDAEDKVNGSSSCLGNVKTVLCSSKAGLKNMCKKVIDFKVLRNALFRMWIPVCFLAIIGSVQIVIFIPPHARDLHISDRDITLLVIIVGASNLISKVLMALLIYCNCMAKHHMIAISLIITGMSCLFINFYTDFVTMTILSVIFGVFGSVYFGLFPAVLVDFVGLEMLSGAMAINMLMQGLGLSISNPILGFLRDFTGSFNASFYLMGTTLIISGSILFLEPFCRKIEIRKIVGVSVESQIEVHHL
uniref:Monocarboxylate transporter 12-like n=1 Tax=Crassostrea virginica TaxID=6565 RepID=A0A8B8EIN4_CRAVI|nr:monocarboxylate transporter 12-like [Crassostrea virginica]